MCKFNAIVSILLSIIIFMPGCAIKKTPQFNPQYYPSCYDPIQKLCNEQNNSRELKEGTIGALLGAVGGAAVGLLTSGSAKGALIGAGAGAAAGGMGGFFHARLSKISDQKERLASYQHELGNVSRSWDIERASVEKSYRCYNSQINILTKQLKNKKISKQDFLNRMNEIKNGIDIINSYWAESKNKMDSALADGESILQKAESEELKNSKSNNREIKLSLNKSRNTTNKIKKDNQNKNSIINKVKDDTNNRYNAAMSMLETVGGYDNV